jgi:hypothetical protein
MLSIAQKGQSPGARYLKRFPCSGAFIPLIPSITIRDRRSPKRAITTRSLIQKRPTFAENQCQGLFGGFQLQTHAKTEGTLLSFVDSRRI